MDTRPAASLNFLKVFIGWGGGRGTRALADTNPKFLFQFIDLGWVVRNLYRANDCL